MVEARYDEREARQFCAQYAAAGDDLALRVYTSRLLGGDPALVLHGGGNTSVKSTARDLFGDEHEVLYVKGSGWDLAAIEPAGFPACKLAPLKRACALPTLSDEAMVALTRREMLDPSSPTPSVEALLHAYLPAKFVDHTHADAVLKVVDQPDGVDRARAVFGDDVLVVPYVMPGFVLAQRVAALWEAWLAEGKPAPRGMVLEKHGIFSWGETAEESYRQMIALVGEAERAVAVASDDKRAGEQNMVRREVALALRGAMSRASDQSWAVAWRSSQRVLAFTRRADLAEIATRGPATPDHVIRTKPWPLVLGDLGEANPAALAQRFDEAMKGYAARYREYFARNLGERNLTALDPYPRVALVPDLGLACFGRTIAQAELVADLYEHTVDVIEGAESLGRYQPVSEADLFDVEYWSLEQAKLGAKKTAAPLEGKIALVTGAASGIGLASARALLAAGAHVVMSDRDARVLEAVSEWPEARFPGRFFTVVCDVTVEADCRRAVETACDRFGGLDVVVSNAGTAPSGDLHTAGGEAALRASLEVNLLGHQRIARLASEVMIAQGAGGVLLFNASKAAFNPGPEFGPYAVPKAALVALMRQYAIDLGKHGIRANAVNADRVRTRLFGEGVLEARAKARGLSPSAYFRANLLGRETTAEQVAEAFVYLAGAEATTGCVITVDGGNPSAFPR
jgi:rhamnose utilization protein RhaD (predicted bifunctional aldolase and dehydrogenase)/NAD(P)-dependent dehydrogenase (short-subunit alcohol dehydrogenase family)